MSKAIILCADDYGLNPAINAGILSLLELGRLSAVSCMTQSPTWQEDAEPLKLWQTQADIGLHFNLTQPFPDCQTSALPLLMLQSKLRLVSKQKIRASFCSQLDTFEKAMGRAPDFIDGHQHVHIFPVVRDIIIHEYLNRYGKRSIRPYMRSLENLPADKNNIKANVLQYMGAKTHTALLNQHNIPHNRAFAGLYDFNPQENLDQRMSKWLNVFPENGLIMCHPAKENLVNSDDAIAAARVSEYTYFSSEQFAQRLNQHHSSLLRLKKFPVMKI